MDKFTGQQLEIKGEMKCVLALVGLREVESFRIPGKDIKGGIRDLLGRLPSKAF